MTCELPEDSFLSWNSGITCITAEKERNQLGWHSWGLASPSASAADRDGWRDLLAGLKSPHGLDED